MKTGRVDCECGDQIISNSGKVIPVAVGIISCWNPKCGIAYDCSAIENARKEGESVTFIPPGKDLKIFQMNECDWWMDVSLVEAKKNYPKFIDHGDIEDILDNPYELTEKELKDLKYFDVELETRCSFLEELQRRQSISDGPEFFASTEY